MSDDIRKRLLTAMERVTPYVPLGAYDDSLKLLEIAVVDVLAELARVEQERDSWKDDYYERQDAYVHREQVWRRAEAENARLKEALREIQTALHLDPFGADPTMDTLGEIQGIVDRAALAGEPAKDTAGDGDAKPGSAEPRQS